MSTTAGELIPRRAVDPRASLPALERAIIERWRERDVFAQSLRMRAGAPAWTFYEGPPTTNGPPGVHHVLSRVFKDVYPRYRTMRGDYVARKGGWDCHGLPVEIAVEKELGIGHKSEIELYGIARFNERCRAAVFSYLKEWNALTERIGFWVDLDDAYRTLDDDYIESVWWAISEIHAKGLLYEGHRVVPYCPRCGTALSSHEVSLGYEDVLDPSVYVRLPLREGGEAKGGEAKGPLRAGDELLVWTTTPWTLVSNAAVAVDPELEYVRAQPAGAGDGPVYIVAAALVQALLGEGAQVLDRFPGSVLEGVSYDPPFDFIPDSAYGERARTVLPADFVSAEEGTGLVHTAIAFGEDDFRLGTSFGLNVINPVRLDGTFDERIGPYAGRFVKDADDDLIEDMRARGRLLRASRAEHSYPHCWRCGTPLLYYAKPSWYIATSRLRENLLAANETVTWYPDHIKHGRFGDWLSNNVDWALSRERYWGTPLPVWRCEGGHIHVIGSFAELRERSGMELTDPHRPFVDEMTFPCPQCEEPMQRVPEVIDVWFDSGSMPFAQHHAPFEHEDRFERHYPADFICEALDQTRGWFYSLIAISTLLWDRAPYRNVVCLGLILDENGEKMSKSRGNTVEPLPVLEEFGADALRWYFFTSKAPWDGYLFSPDTIREGVRQFLLPLWNTYSFYAQYAMVNERALSDGGEAVAVSESERAMDAWLLSRVSATAVAVGELMDAYDATAAGRAIAALVDELSNWYVRRSRRRFWDGEPEAFHTLRTALLTICRLLAPFCPFIADEIYDNLDGTLDSVHLCDFPTAEDLPARDEELEAAMTTAQQAVRLGHRARSQAKLKVRQPLAEAVVVATGRERAAIERLGDVVRDELNVKTVRLVDAADELVSYQVKPDWRRLGPRFGKDMPFAAAAIGALDGAHVAVSIREGRTVAVSVVGRDHVLHPDDVQLAMAPLQGYSVEREGSHAVALELALTDHLVAEGRAREVVHAVQNARRNAGLEISDRIELWLSGDAVLLAAARMHAEYLNGETLAVSLDLDDGDVPGDAYRETFTFDGRVLEVALRRSQGAR